MDRRTFFKTTIAGGATLSAFGFDLAPVRAQTQGLKIARTSETRSTCPYCSVSCGVIIHTLGDKSKNAVPQVVHVEGDPTNRSTAARSPKGARSNGHLDNRRLTSRRATPGSAAGGHTGTGVRLESRARGKPRPRVEPDMRTDVNRVKIADGRLPDTTS